MKLTSEGPEWDPGSNTFDQQESSLLDSRGQLQDTLRHQFDQQTQESRRIAQLRFNPNIEVPEELDLSNALRTRMGKAPSSHTIASIKTSKEHRLTSDILAKRWGISQQQAQRTLQSTTQRGIRTVLHPTLSRRFRSNDRQLRYRRIQQELYTDTMFASNKSSRGNTCAQIFCARNGWCRAYPLRTKGDAHHALSTLFRNEGVPPTLIMDGANEQVKGNFRKKLQQVDCRVRQVEPYTCLLYTSPSPRDGATSRMPSSA